MDKNLTNEDRARVLKTTGVCLYDGCKAHDRLVRAVLDMEKAAYDKGLDDAAIESEEEYPDGN